MTVIDVTRSCDELLAGMCAIVATRAWYPLARQCSTADSDTSIPVANAPRDEKYDSHRPRPQPTSRTVEHATVLAVASRTRPTASRWNHVKEAVEESGLVWEAHRGQVVSGILVDALPESLGLSTRELLHVVDQVIATLGAERAACPSGGGVVVSSAILVMPSRPSSGRGRLHTIHPTCRA